MTPGTIIVLAIVVIIVGAVVAKLVRDKRRGVSSCGCGCDACGVGCNDTKKT